MLTFSKPHARHSKNLLLSCPLYYVTFTASNFFRQNNTMKRNFIQSLLMLLALATGMTLRAQTTTYYVSANNGNDANAGTSAAAPFKTLQKAIAVMNGNTAAPQIDILVEGGLYKPTDGTADAVNRDATFTFFRSFSSGTAAAGKGLRVLGGYNFATGIRDFVHNPSYLDGDIGTADATDNSYHVALIAGQYTTMDSTVVEGFTLRNGRADGAGLLAFATFGIQRFNGGGIFIGANGNFEKLRVSHCVLENNFASAGGGAALRGAATFSHTVFAGNRASQVGGGVVMSDGATGAINFFNCVFAGNAAQSGGALSDNSTTSVACINSTFINNTITQASGSTFSIFSGTKTFTNCIIWDSNPFRSASGGTFDVNYSDVRGGYPGAGNISADPQFVNPANPLGADGLWMTADDGLNIGNCSPAKDAGNNAAVPPGGTSDLKGDTRIENGIVDMGSYEATTVPPTQTAYLDADSDGFGSSTATTAYSCAVPDGYVTNATDCDDADAAVNPSAAEICGNSIDDNCNGQVDENCTVYTFYADTDGDSYGNASATTTNYTGVAPAGYVTNNTDCNDNSAHINPGVAEVCGNNLDDNCNGQVDEGCTTKLTVTILPASITEGNSGKRYLYFTLQLNRPAPASCEVEYETESRTAKSGSDYRKTEGEVCFSKGEVSKTIRIYIYGDKKVEKDEQFIVELEDAERVKIGGSGEATGTIRNDDYEYRNTTEAATTAVKEAEEPVSLLVPNYLHSTLR